MQPYEPSSPPRKKVKGGNSMKKKQSTLFLDLEEDNWARFFIMKKKEGNFTTNCSFKLCTLIKNSIGNAKNVKKLADGTICIEAATPIQASAILALNKIGDIEIEIAPHKKLNSSQGVITCKDFLHSDLEDIKEGLASEGVIDVRRIKRWQGECLVDTASLVLTFNKPKPPSTIEAAFYKLRVRPYIPSPMRCYRCQRFGHTSQRCKAAEQLCVCGKVSHDGDCTPPISCVNCGGDHTAKSNGCPILQKEKEIQKVKTLQQLSYPEARVLVESKYYATPAITFANKLKTPVFQFKAALSPAIRGTIDNKVGESPPSLNIAPTGALSTSRLIQNTPTTSVNSLNILNPQKPIPSSDEGWRVVSPPRRSQRRKDQKKLSCVTKVQDSKSKRKAGSPRASTSNHNLRPLRRQWQLPGTDVDVSDTEGGDISDRPPKCEE
ncbi:uncharacterized protein [Rhodnius prolixus]|uniref:uncharacterized protein n=1 Tax=Rhodnius prolixus TaxID=13249 RepID=UPI003D18949E